MVKQAEGKLNIKEKRQRYVIYRTSRATAAVATIGAIALIFVKDNYFNFFAMMYCLAIVCTAVVTGFLSYKKSKKIYVKKKRMSPEFYENLEKLRNGEFAEVVPKDGVKELICKDDIQRHMFEKAIFVAKSVMKGKKEYIIVMMIYHSSHLTTGRRRVFKAREFLKYFKLSEKSTPSTEREVNFLIMS